MNYIDLHVHTTASDGLFTPKEIVYWAYKKKLSAIAITDHDTIDGIEEALYYGEKYNLEIIPGIEINTDYQGSEVHILGYYIDYKSTWFLKILKEIRFARYNRAKKMIKKINDLGLQITMDEVIEVSGTASIGRPHIARVLVDHNYALNTKEVFEKYIGINGPAYVERYKITPSEAIEYILKCGGIPVLAHPGLIKDIHIIKELVDFNLQGLEVFHSKHNDDMIKLYYSIANQYNLIITGGSDCHGAIYNGQPLLGTLNISKKYLDSLKAKKNNNKDVE